MLGVTGSSKTRPQLDLRMGMPHDEAEEIRQRYQRRQPGRRYHPLNAHVYLARQARERALLAWLHRAQLPDLSALQLLDIGCGSGGDLLWFISIGSKPENLVGAELRPEAVAAARQRLPAATPIILGNAVDVALPESSFDVVLQSMAFSSILDNDFQRTLADRMWRMTKPGGGVLWYDFVYNNPSNPDVRGVPVRRVKQLFPDARFQFAWRLTLAPPISRTVTTMHPGLYSLLNAIPWLRTHVLCWLTKPAVCESPMDTRPHRPSQPILNSSVDARQGRG